MRKIIAILLMFLLSGVTSAQTTYSSRTQQSRLLFTVKLSEIDVDYHLSLQRLSAPSEENKSYRYFLEKEKERLGLNYQHKGDDPRLRLSSVKAGQAVVHKGFEGNLYNYSVPNDNTLAVNKNGILLSAINTNIIFYDTRHDSLLKTISLHAFSDTLATVSTHQYDPKVLYDYQYDRFMVVNLAGASNDTSTHIIVAFQLSDDVLGDWAFYALKGNPLNDTSWTDFPAISLTNDELFITGNLLKYGGSWQTSFKQSVIWQIDKSSGFHGENVLKGKVWYDIKYQGVNIRNIHPVAGGSKYFGPEMYLLSNKNFAAVNDTFYLIKITGLLNDPKTVLQLRPLRADNPYGMPPNPRMPGNKRLATNDARVLGAFLENEVIQWVGNTIDTGSGKAVVYHALLAHPDTATVAQLHLLQNDTLEFGYPNISYTGNRFDSRQAIINVNYTAIDVNPGFGAFFFSGDAYSDLKVLKEGETYMKVLWGALQRWGDYSGSQPLYGEPGKVWVCGTYGKLMPGARIYGTWISLLQTPEPEEPLPPVTQGGVLMYPNPADKSYVQLTFVLEEEEHLNVELFTEDGHRFVLMNDYPAGKGKQVLRFSTATFQSGMYWLRIKGDKHFIKTKKLVVLN